MKKLFSIACIASLACSFIFASPTSYRVSGSVRCEGKGIPGVAVSDGFSVVYTKADGSYSISSRLGLGYVFISTPSGYTAPQEGPFPRFFRFPSTKTKHPGGVDFDLEADPGQNSHTLVCMGDLHLADFHNDLRQYEDFVEDVNSFVKTHPSQKFYGVTVGDMSWDQYWVSNHFSIRDAIASVGQISGMPIYPVIGNHDYELEKAGNIETSEAFRHFVGPVYYSFNIGDVHYVVLDAIECTNTGDGKRSYNRIIVDSELEWFRQDIANVRPDRQLVIISHIPVSGIKNADKLFALTDHFTKPVHFVTAHYHSIQNTNRLKSTDGPRYYDHMAGCPAGSLWMTGYHSPGIHICKDGAPGGYFLLYANGADLSWQYKSTGHPISYQFRVYDGNMVRLDPNEYVPDACRENLEAFRKIAGEWIEPEKENWVFLNVWGRDSEWKIEATENGKPLKVEICKRYDPLHIIAYPAKVLNSGTPAGKIPQNTIVSRHFVKFKASSPDSRIEIKITDRFGNVYRETVVRPLEFSTEAYSNN